MYGSVFEQAVSMSRRMKPGQTLLVEIGEGGDVIVEIDGGGEMPERYTRGVARAKESTWKVEQTGTPGEIRISYAGEDPNVAPIAEPPREPPGVLPSTPIVDVPYRAGIVFDIPATTSDTVDYHGLTWKGITPWETPFDHHAGKSRDRIRSAPIYGPHIDEMRSGLTEAGVEFMEHVVAAPKGHESLVSIVMPYDVYTAKVETLGPLYTKLHNPLDQKGADLQMGCLPWPNREVGDECFIATPPITAETADALERIARDAGIPTARYASPVWTCLTCGGPSMEPLGVGGECKACDERRVDRAAGGKPAKKTRAKKAPKAKGGETCGDSSSESGASSVSAPAIASAGSAASPSSGAQPSTSNSDASAASAVETSEGSPSDSLDDEFDPGDRPSTESTRPAWLDASVDVPDPAPIDIEKLPANPARATIHIDGTGIHGHLFHVLDIDAAGAAIRARLEHEPGVSISLGAINRAEPAFSAQLDATVTTERRRRLLDDLEEALGRLGIEVTSKADWTPSVRVDAGEGASRLLRTQDPPALFTPPVVDRDTKPENVSKPAVKSDQFVIVIAPGPWSKLDPNAKSKLKRTVRKHGIEIAEEGDRLATRPFAKSNSGVVHILDVARELGIEIEPVAA